MNFFERKATLSLSALFAVRMFGLFILLPVLSILGTELEGATPGLLGLAIGIYGLTQACLQIPFGKLSDHYGRKPLIFAGLLLFVIGSLIAGASESIWGLLIGRLLQGSGAIGGIVVALIADSTRLEVRTKAMAFVGASIGSSFLLALILGPILGESIGLSGIFNLVALLGILGMALVIFIVPGDLKPHKNFQTQPIGGSGDQHDEFKLIHTVKNPQLLRINISILLLHMLLTLIFVALPPLLVSQHDIPVEQHWQFYLPVMLGSFLVIIPGIIFAEKKGHIKSVLLIMVGLLLLSNSLFHQFFDQLFFLIVGLFLFFAGFNALEAMLPSLLSKIAPAGRRGICMSTYSTFQFMGAFIGGSFGGYIFEHYDFEGVSLFGGLICALWIALILSLRAPEYLKSYTIALNSVGMKYDQFEQHLYTLPGVQEVFLESKTSVVHLKADKRSFDIGFLEALKI